LYILCGYYMDNSFYAIKIKVFVFCVINIKNVDFVEKFTLVLTNARLVIE
jgi:hypothetical protein